MFTLNTASGTAAINGLGQVLLFSTSTEAELHANASPELCGLVKPVEAYLVPVADETAVV